MEIRAKRGEFMVFIIAEAGVNHNGDLNLAKKMIDVACECNVNAIKFQTFKSEKLVSKKASKADYQKETTEVSESQFEMIKKLELDVKSHKELIDYCKQKNIMFMSTPFDLESIDLLNELGLEIFKIPSGEITNLPYLEKLSKLDKKIILSTGMATMDEISEALKILKSNGNKDISVLHCNTEYPTPMEDVNLKAMNTIKDTFDVEVGYSDHTLGIEVPIAAVSLGAKIIEKHFTLDKNMQGPDHKASLESKELQEMVKSIRNIEKALGDGIKTPSNSELKNIEIVRKSIVANKKIKKGEILTVENLGIKRPATGISPMKWYDVLGTVAKKDYEEDDLIEI